MSSLNCAVLTVSDSRTLKEDTSGALLETLDRQLSQEAVPASKFALYERKGRVLEGSLGRTHAAMDAYRAALDIDPRNIAASRPVALGIVADAKTALAGLAGALEGRDIGGRPDGDLATYRAQHDEWALSLQAPVAAWEGTGIHPGQACAAVGAVFGADAIYCVDGGMTF